MTHWLVVNGDDGGLDSRTDAALIASAREGLLTSVSVVANGPTAPACVAAARAAGIGIGLHLNLSQGAPLAPDVPSLVGDDGMFRPKEWLWHPDHQDRVRPEDVAREAEAQWDRLRTLGVEPDHVDGHNHVTLLPRILRGLIASALDRPDVFFRIPHEPECPEEKRPAFPDTCARRDHPLLQDASWRTCERFVGFAFTHRPQWEAIAHLEHPVPGTTEFMVHPGRRSGTPFTESPFRDAEALFLARTANRERCERLGYRLCRFGDVP